MTDRIVPRLFAFGLGYSALALARRLEPAGWRIAGTAREPGAVADLAEQGFEAYPFSRTAPLADPARALAGTTHVLVSIPPDEAGDPALDVHRADLARIPGLAWVGYLSTTGVYGDTGGGMVDEETPVAPISARSRRRAAAESAWLAWGREAGVPVQVFRLAGIYGPGRSALDRVRIRAAQRIQKPGHLFGRIHVDDIANVLAASIADPRAGAIYNVTDDEPAEPAAVIEFACALLGVEPPPLVPFEAAEAAMSEMARSFWRENRRVSNVRIKHELGVEFRYPTFREGLRAILDAGG